MPFRAANGRGSRKAQSDFGHAQPEPDALGGHFDFASWNGLPVSEADFRGRWTLLYFGYARCLGSCLAVAPAIAAAAKTLSQRGIAARAAFVDHRIAAGGDDPPRGDPGGHGQHGSNWPQRYAMARLALGSGGKLQVLTGSRFQLSQATAAFHVLREHVPPRAGEENYSINHGSMIYLVGPDTLVAGYGFHDMPVGDDGRPGHAPRARPRAIRSTLPRCAGASCAGRAARMPKWRPPWPTRTGDRRTPDRGLETQ